MALNAYVIIFIIFLTFIYIIKENLLKTLFTENLILIKFIIKYGIIYYFFKLILIFLYPFLNVLLTNLYYLFFAFFIFISYYIFKQ